MHIIVHPTGRNSFEFSVPLKLRRAYIVLHIIRYAQIQFPPKRRVYPKRLERARLTGCARRAAGRRPSCGARGFGFGLKIGNCTVSRTHYAKLTVNFATMDPGSKMNFPSRPRSQNGRGDAARHAARPRLELDLAIARSQAMTISAILRIYSFSQLDRLIPECELDVPRLDTPLAIILASVQRFRCDRATETTSYPRTRLLWCWSVSTCQMRRRSSCPLSACAP